MTKLRHIHPADIHGFSRLAVDATLGVTGLVKAMHHTVVRVPGMVDEPTSTPMRGVSSLVYGAITGVTQLVGLGLDAVLSQLAAVSGERQSAPERENMLSALNGVLGDHLAASGNPLALPMRVRHNGQPLELTTPALAAALPQPGGKILLLVHGLCLNDRHWQRKGHDHGAALAADLGYTPVYLHYNTGLHISENGRALADLLEDLLRHWPVPVEELTIVTHSMGGLVARSACHYGALVGQAWLRHLHKMVFLGTPHHGAPLERGGNLAQLALGASPYSTAFMRLGKIRSAGITDLRYGNLVDEDWHNRDRFAHTGDQRRPVPLPIGVQCYAVGATTRTSVNDLHAHLFGDGLVPVRSALGYHKNPELALAIPASHQWVGYDMHHLDLLHRHDVYAQLRQWLSA